MAKAKPISVSAYIKRQLRFYTTSKQAIKFFTPYVFFVIAASMGSFLLHVSTHRHLTHYVAEATAGNKSALSPLRDLLTESLAKIFILRHVSDRALDMMCLIPMAAVEEKNPKENSNPKH